DIRDRHTGRVRASAPEAAEFLLLGDAEGELLRVRVFGNPRSLAQRLMDVFGPHANALLLVELQGGGIERYRELLLVGLADHAVPLDALAQEQRRADRPVILAVALVIVRGAAHLALNHDNQLLTNLEFAGPADEVGDAVEELGDELHLVGVVV